MTKYKVGMINLGCDKNRIDTEIILGSVKKEYEITNNPKEAHIIIVNTCGFIEKSKQESIDTILEMAEYKKSHKCELLVATGCLTQRYGEELLELMPEIDVLLGVNNYFEIDKLIKEFIEKKETIVKCDYSNENINEGERVITTDKHTAYIRIAEGCDNFCTYCIIPKIRGKYRSRKLENIINEAKELANNGVKELILVAQDTTRYGVDIYGEKKLVELIRELSKIEEFEWIRVLYCYPEEITDDLINEIATNDKVCKYLDLPIQHISSEVLKRMGRRTDKESIIKMIDKLRGRIPNMVIRTSLIVGFPGETEDNFNELLQFVKEYKINYLGVFTYSQEEDTPAAIMKDQILEEVKVERQEAIMLAQRDVCKENNIKALEKVFDVIIEKENKDYYIGRTKEMCPDIDGLVYVKKNKVLSIGDIIKFKAEEALEYDLIGVVFNEFGK